MGSVCSVLVVDEEKETRKSETMELCWCYGGRTVLCCLQEELLMCGCWLFYFWLLFVSFYSNNQLLIYYILYENINNFNTICATL
jgi:hypothetical protein